MVPGSHKTTLLTNPLPLLSSQPWLHDVQIILHKICTPMIYATSGKWLFNPFLKKYVSLLTWKTYLSRTTPSGADFTLTLVLFGLRTATLIYPNLNFMFLIREYSYSFDDHWDWQWGVTQYIPVITRNYEQNNYPTPPLELYIHLPGRKRYFCNFHFHSDLKNGQPQYMKICVLINITGKVVYYFFVFIMNELCFMRAVSHLYLFSFSFNVNLAFTQWIYEMKYRIIAFILMMKVFPHSTTCLSTLIYLFKKCFCFDMKMVFIQNWPFVIVYQLVIYQISVGVS